MAKQKIVIKLTLNGDKSRSKAMKIAVSVSGVESAELGGQDKSQIEVIGEDVDAVALTTTLRKKCGYAELVTVSAVGEKKEEKKEEPKVQVQPYDQPYVPPYVLSYGAPYVYEVRDTYPGSCSIM